MRPLAKVRAEVFRSDQAVRAVARCRVIGSWASPRLGKTKPGRLPVVAARGHVAPTTRRSMLLDFHGAAFGAAPALVRGSLGARDGLCLAQRQRKGQ